MLIWIFGEPQEVMVFERDRNIVRGFLKLERAYVRWLLSTRREDIPKEVRKNQQQYRAFRINGENIEFSGGFNDLHTETYLRTLNGGGVGLDEARPAIELAHDIRMREVENARP